MLNKLARTFASQVQEVPLRRRANDHSAARHRQRRRAILGNVNGVETRQKTEANLMEFFCTHERSRALLGHGQALTTPVPSPGCARLEGVPVPRGAGRSAKWQS